MIFNFYKEEIERWEKINFLALRAITDGLLLGKSFSVRIGDVEKTPKQLRGFYRLCGIVAPAMGESQGVLFDKEMVKEFVKQECNYCTMCKGRIITKSLTKASREELNMLIERIIEIGESLGIKECKLTSYEQQAFNEYYNNKK